MTDHERDALDERIDESLRRQLGAPENLEETARALVARARLRPMDGVTDEAPPAPSATPGTRRVAGLGWLALLGGAAAALLVVRALVAGGDAADGDAGPPVAEPGGVEDGPTEDALAEGGPVEESGLELVAAPLLLRCDPIYAECAPPPAGQDWVAGTFCEEPKSVDVPLASLGGRWARQDLTVALIAGDSLGEPFVCGVRPETTVIPARVENDGCVLLVDPADVGFDWVVDPESDLRTHTWEQDGLRFCEINAREGPLLRPRIEP